MTVTNFPKRTGVNTEFTPKDNITNNPAITGVGGGGNVIPMLIDQVGVSSVGAYSFKQLTASYTGPVVKVRRSSDDEELDFTAAQVESELEAFLDGTQGYCSCMYDQSGNARHIVQANSADQPEVMKDPDNSLWCINMINGDFLRADTFAGTTTNMSMHIMWSCTSNGSSPLHNSFQGGLDFASNSYFMPWWTQANSPTFGGSTLTDFDWIDSKVRVHGHKWLNGTTRLSEFGANSRITHSQANPPFTRLTVGKNDIVSGNFKFFELAFFPADIDMTVVASTTKGQYPGLFNFRFYRQNMGDSNTSAGFSNTSQQWTKKVYDSVSYSGVWLSRALGATELQHYVDNPEYITQYINLFDCTSFTFNLFLGTNDLIKDGATGESVLALYEQVCDILRNACDAKGASCTINAFTMLPRTTVAWFNAGRLVFNAGIIANANSKWDNVIDTTSNANLEDQNNATYFVDTTHLSDTGHTELAALVAAVS